MKSEFDVLKTGKIHCQKPLGGGAVRSRSGTRNVRGLLIRCQYLLLLLLLLLPTKSVDASLLDPAKPAMKHEEKAQLDPKDS